MDEAWEGKLRGAGAAAYCVFGFQHGYGAPVSRQLYCGGQTIGTGAYYQGIVHLFASSSAHASDSTLPCPRKPRNPRFGETCTLRGNLSSKEFARDAGLHHDTGIADSPE